MAGAGRPGRCAANAFGRVGSSLVVEQRRQAALLAFLQQALDSRFRLRSQAITRQDAHRQTRSIYGDPFRHQRCCFGEGEVSPSLHTRPCPPGKGSGAACSGFAHAPPGRAPGIALPSLRRTAAAAMSR